MRTHPGVGLLTMRFLLPRYPLGESFACTMRGFDTAAPLLNLKKSYPKGGKNMQPVRWQLPVELSTQEEHIVKRIRKAKLFVFLRQHRHVLLDEAFQRELASLYRPAERGQPPIAPAMLALALILEAYTGVSDDEVIEATVMDKWIDG